MSGRLEKLQQQADEAMKNLNTEDAAVQDEPQLSNDYTSKEPEVDFQRELNEAKVEREKLIRERDEYMRERDSYANSVKEKESYAEKSSTELAELQRQLAKINEEKELELTDADYSGLDPDLVPVLKKIIEKQSRSIARIETKRLREEVEGSFLAKAKGEVLAEVESRQSRSTFDAKLRSDGQDNIYDVINDDAFKQFIKEDDVRIMAFANAATTKDDASARVIKRLVKDFSEKAVNKPAKSPRIGGKVATTSTNDDEGSQIDHQEILRLVKSSDPAEKKRGQELLNKATERLSSKLKDGLKRQTY